MRRRAFLTLVVLVACVPAWSAVKTVEWNDLSDRDISPQGRSALSDPKDGWKHAETEHFVFHFPDEKQAETVVVHAELYYDWIKKFFGVEEDRWKKKAHVFVFEDSKLWHSFLEKNGSPLLEAGGYTNGWELFLKRDPLWLAPMQVVAHELTHILLFRFVDGSVPLFLNEGFAEYVSARAVATRFDGDEYQFHTIPRIEREKYVPLAKLAAMRAYGADSDTFYRESELVVRFLIQQAGSRKFYALLRAVSSGEDWTSELEMATGLSAEEFERQFKPFATGERTE